MSTGRLDGSATGLRINPAVEIIRLGDGQIQFYGASPSLTVRDEEGHLSALISWCDGSRSETDVLTLLSTRIADADKLLGFLIARRCLVAGDRAASRDVLVDLMMMSRPEDPPANRPPALADRRIEVVGSGVLFDSVLELLSDLEPTVSARSVDGATQGHVDLSIVLSDACSHTAFRNSNRLALSSGVPALFASVDRAVGRVGPLVVPRQTACFECFHYRLRANSLFRTEYDARVSGTEHAQTGGAVSRIVARSVGNVVTTAALGWLMNDPRMGRPNRFIELDVLTLRVTTHAVLKLPRCPACGHGADALHQSAYQPQRVG
jgi:bacteriocin biosynthesis cyclodehydratase domain-containing protein